MEIQFLNDEKLTNQILGETRFIGRKTASTYEDGKVVEEVGSITFDIGAPSFKAGKKEGGTIEIKVMTDQLPNIQPYGRVKFENLVYDPYATTASTGDGGFRGVIVDRFRADAILPYSDADKKADENGELNKEPVKINEHKNDNPKK